MQMPTILESDWGSIRINVTDETKQYKDVKLYPGGARAWDWTETDTHHQPGIQPADAKELIDHNAQYILFSRGRLKKLHTADETQKWLREQDIPFEILETGELIQRYQELKNTKALGALIHTTC